MDAWPPWAFLLALAVVVSLPAPAAFAAQAAPAVSKPQPLPRGKRSGLDRRVATLTRALDLNPKQQVALRKVLLEQREQVQRIWSDPSTSSADRMLAMHNVGMQTSARIRALLNEEQRKKYGEAAPQRTTSGANVEEWMYGGKKQ